LAILLTFFSVIASREGPLWVLNLLVIAPLWATAAVLFFKGKVKRVVAIVAIVLSATILSMTQTAIFAGRTSRKAITRYRMISTCERIQAYMKQHRRVPPSLTALPAVEGDADKAEDGWGHEIQYSVDHDGVITLTSFGVDGKPGGDGQDADIIMRYRTRNADGTLNVDDESWIKDARIE
jgi:hypothetical protein